MKTLNTLLAAAALTSLPACMYHNVETTSEVKPIHIVLDINVKVDKALDNYFAAPQAQDGKPAVMPEQVSLEDAMKPVDPAMIPPREVMMGRFVARKADVRKLKSEGIVGEGASGFLLFVSVDKKESEKLVEVENADRKVVYERVAKLQNSTVDRVAKLKGEKNTREAKPGEYIQDASGAWVKKQSAPAAAN